MVLLPLAPSLSSSSSMRSSSSFSTWFGVFWEVRGGDLGVQGFFSGGGAPPDLHLLGAESLGLSRQHHGVTFGLAVHVTIGRFCLRRFRVFLGGFGVPRVPFLFWGGGVRGVSPTPPGQVWEEGTRGTWRDRG